MSVIILWWITGSHHLDNLHGKMGKAEGDQGGKWGATAVTSHFPPCLHNSIFAVLRGQHRGPSSAWLEKSSGLVENFHRKNYSETSAWVENLYPCWTFAYVTQIKPLYTCNSHNKIHKIFSPESIYSAYAHLIHNIIIQILNMNQRDANETISR